MWGGDDQQTEQPHNYPLPRLQDASGDRSFGLRFKVKYRDSHTVVTSLAVAEAIYFEALLSIQSYIVKITVYSWQMEPFFIM